jgi:predicted nuclease of predicted toxin-antitoxin system
LKWKLDENFGSRTVHVFLQAGEDADNVLQEELSGASDQTIYDVCIREDRCLLTLDIDFADVVRFPPHRTAGIVVLRLPRNPSLSLIESLVRDLVRFQQSQSIRGRLLIVEPGRVRIHEDTDPRAR